MLFGLALHLLQMLCVINYSWDIPVLGEHKYKTLHKSSLLSSPLSSCILTFKLQESEKFFFHIFRFQKGCSAGYLSGLIETLALVGVGPQYTVWHGNLGLCLIPEEERSVDTPHCKNGRKSCIAEPVWQDLAQLKWPSDMPQWWSVCGRELWQLLYVLWNQEKCPTQFCDNMIASLIDTCSYRGHRICICLWEEWVRMT